MMKCILAALLLVAVAAQDETTCPPKACPRNLRPVCGTDGQTYNNECMLEAETCGSVQVASQGRCPDTSDEEPQDTSCPLRACTKEYNPVCGVDGQTYGNECMARATLCNEEEPIAFTGPCDAVSLEERQDTTCPPRPCYLLLRPVCGVDGKTYSNDCVAAATLCNEEEPIAHEGPCEEQQKRQDSECPIVCPQIYGPVCGVDGKTYSNECFAKAANCDADEPVAYKGPCEEDQA